MKKKKTKKSKTLKSVTVNNKPRRLKATWSLGGLFGPKPLRELEEEFSEVFDRWTWETGSEEDREEMERLKYAINLEKGIDSDDLFDQMCKEVSDEMDAEITKELQKQLQKEK